MKRIYLNNHRGHIIDNQAKSDAQAMNAACPSLYRQWRRCVNVADNWMSLIQEPESRQRRSETDCRNV